MGTPARPVLAVAVDENAKRTGKSAHPTARVALLSLAAMALLAVVIVTIKTKDGKETTVAVNVPGEVTSVSAETQADTAVKPVPAPNAPRSQPALPPAIGGAAAAPAKFLTLAGLDPAQVPESERFDWQPEQLVAVIGTHRLRHWNQVLQTRFHPSGEFFVTVGEKTTLTLTKSLESPMNDLPVKVAQWISPLGFKFSQDGKWMYSRNQIYSVNMTDAANPRIELARTLPGEDSGHANGAIYDDRWLIYAADTPGELLIWDLAAQPARLIKTVKYESKQRIISLTVSADGRSLAGSKVFYGPVRVWDIDWTNADDPSFTLRDQQVPGSRVEMSPRDSIMAACLDGTGKIELWDVSQTPFQLLHQIDGGQIFAFSPDGKLLAVSQQGSIVWDLEETPPREYRLQLSTSFQNAFFTADNKRLFVADESGVGIYDWASNREVRRLKYPGPVRQIVPHPDGRHLATVNGNGTVYILRLPELAEHSKAK